MKNNLTLGSLFDGSGGFPLGGLISGITPLWASEVEPFPIRVTTKRLPQVKHLGDVSKIKGDEIPPVDIITFGSPCQDMSIAGKREGLAGGRSSLFYEAVRIIKEMRCKTNGEYPRFVVWENVPGAFSSNKGEDFREVLKSLCEVKSADVTVPESGIMRRLYYFLDFRTGNCRPDESRTHGRSLSLCCTERAGRCGGDFRSRIYGGEIT